MKHKHHETIKAYIEGIDCQCWLEKTQQWLLITALSEFDYWDKVRIKPEPKPDVVKYATIKQDISSLSCHKFNSDNLKLTFDGETLELKSAEVIK